MEHIQNPGPSSQSNYFGYIAMIPYYPQYNVPIYPMTLFNYTVPIQLIPTDYDLSPKFSTQISSPNESLIQKIDPKEQPLIKLQVKKRKLKFKNKSKDCQMSESFEEAEDSEFRINKTVKISKKKTIKAKPNQERNIIPNLIQQVFSFLSKESRSIQLISKIFQKFNTLADTKIQRYYIYQKKIKQKLDHCVNLETLKILTDKNWKPDQLIKTFSAEEMSFYQKISRISAKYFLSEMSPLLTLHSKRMPDWKRFNHLNRRRIVLNHLK